MTDNKLTLFPLRSDKSPAVGKGVDWREYDGEVKTKLIGVAIPNGIIIFDIDTYKGVSKEDVESLFGCSFDWNNAELQKTTRGGVHYAFNVPGDSDLKNGVDLFGLSGFDTRSAGKGYIATGEGYRDLTLFGFYDMLANPSDFPALPEQALEMLKTESLNNLSEDDDFFEMVVGQPLDIDQDEVAMYMSKLTKEHAADSVAWLKVMFALYHQCKGDDWGWDLFDEFSRLAPEKYDERQNRSRWISAGRSKKANPITFATVIDMVGGREVVSVDKFEALHERVLKISCKEDTREILKEIANTHMDELNHAMIVKALTGKLNEVYDQKLSVAEVKKIIRTAKKREVNEYYEDYVFLTHTALYMHRETKAVMGPRAFDVRHNRDTPADQEGNPQSATGYVNNRIECVHDGMYAPIFDDIFNYEGINYFNTYRPCALKRVGQGKTDVVERIKKHIAHLLPDEIEQQIVIDYLAHNVQFPGKKLFWAIVLQGVQGDGKSFLAEMMKHVLGASNCRSISAEALDEKFTPWAEGNVMVFLEEMKIDNIKKYETPNKMKPYITNMTVSVRKMRTDIYECINTTNYFALTNYKDALPLDDNDRRWCILFSQWQSKQALAKWMTENPGYYEKLYDDMRNNAGEVLDWLLTHKISSGFLKTNRAPETRAKRTMIDMSKGEDYLLVEDAISEFKCHDINDFVVNVTKLNDMVLNSFDSDYRNFPKTNRLKNIMIDMGYHSIGRYKTTGEIRKNQLLYCKDDKRNAVDFKDPDGDFVPF